MSEKMKLKIGEFARLGQVTVQTLRYYADLGLLPPGSVDPFTGYRYYYLDQLPVLHRVLALKDMSIPLEQIKIYLHDEISTEEMRQILLQKQSEIRAHMQVSLDQLERINLRLQMLKQNTQPLNYEVNIKHVDPLPVTSIKDVVPNYWDVNPLWMKLHQQIQRNNLKIAPPYLTLCHSAEIEILLEVCAPVTGVFENTPETIVHFLPEINTMAFTTHQGGFSGLINGYTALMQWVDDNGFETAGPDREVYLRFPSEEQIASDPNAITELQIPVRTRKD